jgi:hypothetical protein
MMVFRYRQWQGLRHGTSPASVFRGACLKGAGLLIFLVGCGGGDAPPEGAVAEADSAEAMMAAQEAALPAVVRIVSPANGATVAGDAVEIVLEAENAEIAPVDQGRMETAHHHLFVNTDVTPMGEVIPMGRDGIIHMGDGSTSFTLRDLAPGEYRIIAVLADLLHIPLDPPAVDTIFITVR